MTARQLRAWREWLKEERNRPSRADHYAMQTSLAINRSWGGKAELEDFKIRWGPREPEPGGLTEEQLLKASQQIWIGRAATTSKTGKPVSVTYKTIKRSELGKQA